MIRALVAGLLAGYGVAVPVGAVGALLMSLTARAGLRVGAAAALGVAAADGVYALVAVLGGASLARYIEPVAGPLRWLAVAALATIAAYTATTAILRHRDPARVRDQAGLTTPIHAFTGLLGLTLLNPMTIVYFAALVLGRRSGGAWSGAAAAVWVGAVFLASVSWQLLLAGGGVRVGRMLAGPRGRLGTALVSSALVAALAVGLLVR